jgi:hypothetical protein
MMYVAMSGSSFQLGDAEYVGPTYYDKMSTRQHGCLKDQQPRGILRIELPTVSELLGEPKLIGSGEYRLLSSNSFEPTFGGSRHNRLIPILFA